MHASARGVLRSCRRLSVVERTRFRWTLVWAIGRPDGIGAVDKGLGWGGGGGDGGGGADRGGARVQDAWRVGLLGPCRGDLGVPARDLGARASPTSRHAERPPGPRER